MRTSSDPGRLNEMLRDFNRLWTSSSEGWNDDSRASFERQHISELQRHCDEALSHLTQLNHVLTTTIQRCQ